MTTINDLTFLEFILVGFHSVTAASYLVLAMKIRAMKKYLMWNRHIYPTMMWGALVLSIALFWLLTSEYFYNVQTDIAWMMITIFSAMMAIGYTVAAEAIRLAHKYEKIQEQDKQIHDMTELLKKHKLLIFIPVLFVLLGCGGYKKEIERLKTEDRTKTEQYERRLSELNSKISETEKRETETKTELQKKETEISNLKKEKESVQQQLEQLKEEDIIIENANGTVKITDHNGNTYEVPSTSGTTIAKSSLTKLSQQLNSVKESLSQATERAQILTQNIFQRDKTIKELKSEIKAKNDSISKMNENILKKDEQLSKEVTKKGTPFYVWIGAGMFLMLLLQLGWKYRPMIIKLFTK